MRYPLSKVEQTLMSILVGVTLGVLTLVSFRAALPAPRPRSQPPVEWDGKCLGRPGDADRVVYWMGPPYLPGDGGRYGTRYVCVDHGPEHNGFWFEAKPRERMLP